MNFSPFTGHFPATIPTIHQFAAKFTHDGTTNALIQTQDAGNRYHANNVTHFNQHPTSLGMAVNVGKFRQPENVVVSLNNVPNSGGNATQQNIMNTVNTGGTKYHTITTATTSSPVGLNNLTHQYTGQISVPYSQNSNADGLQQQQQLKSDRTSEKNSREAAAYEQDMMNATILHQQQSSQNQGQLQQLQQPTSSQQLVVVVHEAKEHTSAGKSIKQEIRTDHRERTPTNGNADFLGGGSMAMPASWQSLAAPGSAVADYLSHLPASTLPLSLHHFLKYSADTIKKDDSVNLLAAAANVNGLNNVMATNVSGVVVQSSTLLNQGQSGTSKKKKKKKPPKEKKPRPKPGEIRLTTALDGSTLYCCPECHMAYPERGMLEQHLVGHTMERRFICDICNAALKRKDHLTRHKQSHNPERPYVCSVCLKAFKRKEQLTLHFVIHSGEKRHICQECGKGFYRKDHLRKHTRSHIARRVKAELSQQGGSGAGSTLLSLAVPAPAAPPP
ncbi:uncharacterized protein LOC143920924 [Arctopsyche grandis]|uniref:uncharacterized protein LOC143920924 n=1 Tax=Arctopsyche grandis TaxID=121162 RepID=UPI00406D9CA4